MDWFGHRWMTGSRKLASADAHTAEQALRHGMIDAIVPRRELRATLQRLLRLLSNQAHAIPETSLLVPSISL